MRFDLLIASISPGIYAPLALMGGGALLAVMGLVFLLLRRRAKAKPAAASQPAEVATTSDQTGDHGAENDAASTPAVEPDPVPAPAPSPLGRRRSLVGVAEREEGTPSGEIAHDAGDTQDEADFGGVEDREAIEEAEFEEIGPDGEADEFEEIADAADDTADDAPSDLDADDFAPADFDAQAEPEWSEDDAVAEPATSPEVEAARETPIVFRQFLPQSPGDDGLSFYGGQPIGPADFQWPRERADQGGAPLQFLMQWDCSQLAQQDATGLLPQDGVLYCFVNCDQDAEADYLSSHAFVHHNGPVDSWGPVDIPEDAGPALGKTAALKLSGCTDAVANADDYVPRIMPRFPFTPVAFQYPAQSREEAKAWSSAAAAQVLLEIQKSGPATCAPAPENEQAQDESGRPFAAFPHDFGAIRVIASRMIDALKNPDPVLAEALFSDLSPEQREAQFNGWCEEAKELYLLGTQRPEGHRLEPNISDDIWNWFAARGGILGTDLSDLVVEAVDLSLSVSSEALASVPAEWIDEAMGDHALARDDMGDVGENIHAPVPARMFGPPSPHAGMDAELVDEHILLLELPSGSGPQHDFGGKTLQYWIAPDDLAAGNFDDVKSVVTEG